MELQDGLRLALDVDLVILLVDWTGFKALELLELQFSNPIRREALEGQLVRQARANRHELKSKNTSN